MNDIIVSVRMPKSLVRELKARQKHFLDLSEEVRSIVRKKWLQYQKPELYELKQLRSEINKELKRKSIERIQNQVNKELEKIREQLKKGDILND